LKSHIAFRRGYIDLLRGVAVLIMIEAHTIDAWTRAADRRTPAFDNALTLGGFGAPLFLFLAGVAIPLSIRSKERKTGDRSRAAASVRRRGWQIFGLAFLFRLQSFLLSPGSSLAGILKVDILNIMGPAIVMAACLWQVSRQRVVQAVCLSGAAVAFAMVTPLVRDTGLLDALPDPLEWYLRPAAGKTNFVLFPWAGFVFAGAAVGMAVEKITGESDEKRVHLALGAIGATLAAAGYGASFLPSIYSASDFWTSSPTFFFLRLGLIILVFSLAYAWGRRTQPSHISPLQQLGRTSLFIYWIHVEMVYGLLTYPLHRALPIQWAFVAFGVFSLLMYGVSVLKTRFTEGRLHTPPRGQVSTTAPA